MNRLVVALALLVAATAQADVWQQAIARGQPDPARDEYELQMKNGDDLALLAATRAATRRQILAYLEPALRAYHAASHAQPAQPEPYYRIGALLDSFFHDCTDGPLGAVRPTCDPPDPTRWREAVEAWDEFEQRAPLDPRINDLLFQRAIMRTKLSADPRTSREDLEAAARDYRALLDRSDGLVRSATRQVLGNLAETYMMLGRLEEAIETYSAARREGADISTAYGLAVALDRDENPTKALAVIRAQGRDSYEGFKRDYLSGAVFYVPKGEEYYYFALIDEAFGNISSSIAHWRAFLSSGAHPQFHARAKAHLDALQIKQRTNPRVPPPEDLFERLP
ncbi:MAG: tetratricopeptide repeat protein [Kofleriaceae bacterium]